MLREGGIIAQGSPAGILEQTRTADLESAFLALEARREGSRDA